MQKISKNILKQVYKPRPPESRKYDFGLLLVIGGGEFYTGSPALSAMAALRAGVDMTQILAPKRAADIIAGFSPNLAALPLKGKWLDKEDLACLFSMTIAGKENARGKMAVVIGGGLGRSPETKETILEYLKDIQAKAVVDSDALRAVAFDKSAIIGRNFILTPHLYEFQILSGKDVSDFSLEKKAEAVKQLAKELACVVVLKGHHDIIASGQEVAVNETGSPYLTVGGTGDTLSGIAGAFLAMGLEPFLAAQAACYINGRAGQLAVAKYGPGVLATDLIEEIPQAIK